MTITPDQARELLDGTTPGPWEIHHDHDQKNTMSTNIDRAADHMESLDRLYDYGSGHMPSNAERAQALADAGLLAPDLPAPDRDGYLWPMHGRNYGHVRRTMIQPHVGDPIPGVLIARGGPGKASTITPMRLTKAEALELASLLTAAAQEDA